MMPYLKTLDGHPFIVKYTYLHTLFIQIAGINTQRNQFLFHEGHQQQGTQHAISSDYLPVITTIKI